MCWTVEQPHVRDRETVEDVSMGAGARESC